MTKTKIWLIVAASLSALGIIIFAGVMTVNNWDFKKLYTAELETNTYEITEDFSDISISLKTADLELLPSSDGKALVVCAERKKVSHEVKVQNGTLDISIKDSRKWYEHIELFSLGKEKITVYLPENEYEKLRVRGSTGDVKTAKDLVFKGIDISLSTGDTEILSSAKGLIEVESDTGDIFVENIEAGELALTVTTGKIEVKSVNVTEDIEINVSTGKSILSDVTCKNLDSNGDTGDITLENTVAVGKFNISRDTGNVEFSSADATEIYVETSTGRVTGSFVTDKIIFAESSTGRIDVPKCTEGGRCEIKTDTGNIKIEIK